MATDIEVRTSAKLMIERFGADAAAKAHEVAEGFAALGSGEREGVWVAVARAIEAMQRRRAGSA